nr:hypothetical protein [Tanacetum cinerariifolium]
MDNVIEVFDAKVTMRSTLHTLASIKELLCKSGNERRNTMFRSTQFGKWLDFPSFANSNHLLNYIFQHQMYTNNKYRWKKDPLVIPRSLSWSKIGNFEKGDYGILFAEWYSPILSMAPTSNELLQRWFIRSMEYFGSHDVEHEPLLTDHEILVGENIIVAFERQSEPDVSVERQSKPDVAQE